ncbi:UDP-N-acetylmuramoyl-L-alanine--D-glutamate ligase [Bacillus sp. FJAT-44742]|uniref:UDP-N-acetylmuramoyl-L-alanine--D-glutamate ligase n=1 Tax=Bacillus sp. FJAT-44742 TaxID=2014005 RepID=UPI000C232D8B|nr:UDP-N-acetylmuramoyl-L-alanine--D-glutamate ligase [Bacillus sp. FJAT-44742]
MKQIKDFENKAVLVLGLAKSGMAAARLLNKLGADVTVNDAKDLAGTEEEKALRKEGITLVSGGHPAALLDEADYVVKNPGIPYHNPLVSEAVNRNLPVVTEIELASLVCEGDIVSISGSNGKTTTTTLLYEMLKGNENKKPWIAGNIGTVACEVAQEVKAQDIMVTEVSSFQLKGTKDFHPRVAVLLNIFDAHLDYHGDRLDYEQSKGKMFTNMTSEDVIIYNSDDPVVETLAKHSKAQLVPFSASSKQSEGAYVENGWITFKEEPILSLKEASLPGAHNVENMLAAVAAAKILGGSTTQIIDVLKTFHGVKHRLQFVGNINGRKIYNDSKATNILATQKALSSFTQPVVLLAGGLDRGNSFDDLIPYLAKVKGVVTYGETKGKIAEAAYEAGVSHVEKQNTLEEAVKTAYKLTEEGDVLLLSPACASWDQFKTFEERGETFIKAVQQLQ